MQLIAGFAFGLFFSILGNAFLRMAGEPFWVQTVFSMAAGGVGMIIGIKQME